MENQQFVRAKADPPGCPGFTPNVFKRQWCGNCSGAAVDHHSATDDQILLAVQLNTSDVPSLIVPGVYVAGYKAAMSLKVLQKTGITHVVNTAKGINEVFPTFKEFSDQLSYLHLNMVDAETEDLTPRLEESLNFISQAVKSGGKVLVHCMQGKSRSGSIVVAYLMAAEGLGYTDALKKAQSQRPVIEPNSAFERQLREFEKSELLKRLRTTS